MWINPSGLKANTSFANKLYLNKQQHDGLTINNLLKLLVNIYWKNKYGFYLGCNDTAAGIIVLYSRADIIRVSLYDFVEKTSAEKLAKIDTIAIKTQHICRLS